MDNEWNKWGCQKPALQQQTTDDDGIFALGVSHNFGIWIHHLW